MLALLLLGVWGALAQPYDTEAWSVLAAKWLVPFALFHIAGPLFQDEASLRKLEAFLLAVLIYLTVISVLFLFGLKSFIFPRYVLDESLGIHVNRARGPFLQAVANGVSLNILALIAVHSFERRRLHGLLAVVLFFTVHLAILATKTRAVWLSAAMSVGMLLFFGHRTLRRVALALCAVAGVAGCLAFLYQADSADLSQRLQDRSPVEFRMQMYQAGWQMFLEKPLAGWGTEANIQPEIAKRIEDAHPERYIFHNTYLELAVEHGIVGLGLYGWLVICLFRLRPPRSNQPDWQFLGDRFRAIWLIVLVVYFVNASVVVMNYQFLNGVVFAIAGILSMQSRSSATSSALECEVA
jgi:O-antigen ligase